MRCLALVLLASAGVSAMAGEADVVAVEHLCTEERVCSFAVTVRHDDEGWEHYADGWELLDRHGNIVATRVLAHPHDDEQPFTRSLDQVPLGEHVLEIRVRAHDKVHGYGGKQIVVRPFE